MSRADASEREKAHQDRWLESQNAEQLREWIRKGSCLCDMAGICNGCKLADAEAEIRRLKGGW